MASILSEFGKRLAERAKEMRITQEKLAEKTNKSVPTIKKWYSGEARPQIEALIELANLLECDIDYLCGHIKEKTHDNTFICDSLGLSESAIDYIKELPPVYKNVLDMLLSNNSGLYEIMEDLARIRIASCQEPEKELDHKFTKGIAAAYKTITGDKRDKKKDSEAREHLRRAYLIQSEAKEHIQAIVSQKLRKAPPVLPPELQEEINEKDPGGNYEATYDFMIPIDKE